jgi:membrane-associated phospholipid phosphatase
VTLPVLAAAEPLDRKFLAGVAIVAAVLMLTGFAGADRPLAEWVHTGGVESAPAIVWLMNAIEIVFGFHWSRWLFGAIVLPIGIAIVIARRQSRFGRALVVATLVQLATNVVMLAGKDYFARLRPFQVFEAGDWSHVWFGGGVSFPSGHLAFFAGFFVPFAASVRNPWLRAALMLFPIFFAIARIDVLAHFLSDVSASTLIAALLSLLAAAILARIDARATRT